MKPLNLVCLLLAFSLFAQSQTKEQPLFTYLSNVKNYSEFAMKSLLKKQELEVATLDKDKQAKKQLELFKDNMKCMESYNRLKARVDKLITQLCADLTISNKRKAIKSLHSQAGASSSIYQEMLKEIKESDDDLTLCLTGNNKAVGVDEITGIFSAIATVVTGSRDARAKQVEALCGQLEKLRLTDVFDLTSGKSSASDDEK